MLQRWFFLAAACMATPVLAAGVTPLPEEVSAVVDGSRNASVACVETDDAGDVRGGWWRASDPDSVELCTLLPGGTFVDPAACNYNDGKTIVGRADVTGFPEVPVICLSGASTPLNYFGTTYRGHADVCSRNGKRIWGALESGGIWYPMLWRDDNVIAWDSASNISWLTNFLAITEIQFTGCSDDGRYACGWYEWNNGSDRFPFVIDSEDPTAAFEDCFGGLTRTNAGEARCVSGEGSRVAVWNSVDDEAYVADSADPSTTLDSIGEGSPRYCNADGSVVIGQKVVSGDEIGWIWKEGEGQSEIAVPADFDGTPPTTANADCTVVGGALTNGTDAAYLWKDGFHGAIPALRACRDSLDLPLAGYSFTNVSYVSEGGRDFYTQGQFPGGDAKWFYCELEDGPRFVWDEAARFYPPYISEYCFYAYFYAIYANAFGGNPYIEVASAYGQYAYAYDAPSRDVAYDYWQRPAALAEYEDLRYQQFLYEYYCYLYLYYGGQSGQTTPYLQNAQAYSLYAAQFLLEEL